MFSFTSSFSTGVKAIAHGGRLVGEGLEVIKLAVVSEVLKGEKVENDKSEVEAVTLITYFQDNICQIVTTLAQSGKAIVDGVNTIGECEVHAGLDKIGDGLIGISESIKSLQKFSHEVKEPLTKALIGMNTIADGIDEIGQALENMLYRLKSTKYTGMQLKGFAAFLKTLITELMTVDVGKVLYHLLKFAEICEWIGWALKKICAIMIMFKRYLWPIVNFFASIFRFCVKIAIGIFEKVENLYSNELAWMTDMFKSLLMQAACAMYRLCAEKRWGIFAFVDDVFSSKRRILEELAQLQGPIQGNATAGVMSTSLPELDDATEWGICVYLFKSTEKSCDFGFNFWSFRNPSNIFNNFFEETIFFENPSSKPQLSFDFTGYSKLFGWMDETD